MVGDVAADTEWVLSYDAWDDGRAKVMITIVCQQTPYRRRVGLRLRRGDDMRRHAPAIADGPQVIYFGFQRRAAVEDINIALITQSFGLQNFFGGFGLGMHFADSVARFCRQEIHIKRMLRH